MSLNDHWKFGFQLYVGWEIHYSGSFSKVSEFWQGLAHLPRPSQLLKTGDGPRSVFLGESQENVRAIILARSDVTMDWNHPTLERIYQYESPNKDGRAIDALFEDYCVDMVGEKYPTLLGIRLLDRSKKGSVNHRWEFWCSGQSDELHGIITSMNGKVQQVKAGAHLGQRQQ